MSDNDKLESFISEWALTGGSELANTQSFVNGLCALIGVDPPKGVLLHGPRRATEHFDRYKYDNGRQEGGKARNALRRALAGHYSFVTNQYVSRAAD